MEQEDIARLIGFLREGQEVKKIGNLTIKMKDQIIKAIYRK